MAVFDVFLILAFLWVIFTGESEAPFFNEPVHSFFQWVVRLGLSRHLSFMWLFIIPIAFCLWMLYVIHCMRKIATLYIPCHRNVRVQRCPERQQNQQPYRRATYASRFQAPPCVLTQGGRYCPTSTKVRQAPAQRVAIVVQELEDHVSKVQSQQHARRDISLTVPCQQSKSCGVNGIAEQRMRAIQALRRSAKSLCQKEAEQGIAPVPQLCRSARIQLSEQQVAPIPELRRSARIQAYKQAKQELTPVAELRRSARIQAYKQAEKRVVPVKDQRRKTKN